MRKIKVAPRRAQVTDPILAIALHCDFIDFSEINLIFYCTEESWLRREEEEEIPTRYVSCRKDFFTR